MEKIRMEHIRKCYTKGDAVIEDFSLAIDEGEFVVLLGPSGCGKSTLLRIIAGLEDIDAGAVYIDGSKVNDVSPKDRDIAMVFQNYALYPHMTVYKNIAISLQLRHLARAVIDEKVRQTARSLDLEGVLDRKPRELSGGQMQRVALARAIVRQPKVFLMDEPLSNLDAKLRVHTRAEIIKLYQRLGTTTIFVTHDQVEALTMATQIVLLNEGRVQQQGTPEELYDRPVNLFVAGFIGTPQMNFFSGRICRGQAELLQRRFPVEAPDQDIIGGLRPEAVTLVPGSAFTVDFIENLGSEKYAYLKDHNGQTATVRCRSGKPVRIGMTFDLDFAELDCHLFNRDSQQRII